jgi:ABC-type glycerol-3-phosphate transport system substrate-binding protein
VVTDGGQTFPQTSGFSKAMRPMYDLITPQLKKQLGGYLAEEGQGDPAHYAIPNLGNVHVVYYNKADFAHAHIASKPRTFNQMLSDCKALWAKNIVPMTNGWSGPAGTLMWNYGIMSQLLTPTQFVEWANVKFGWKAPQFLQGLKDVNKMTAAHCFGDPATAATETDVDGLSAFEGGRGAMLFWNSVAPSSFASVAGGSSNVGAFALPKMPTSVYPVGTTDGGYNANWSLMSYTKHCLAAWDWIKFDVSPKAQQIMWDVSQTIPVNHAVKLTGTKGLLKDLLHLATNKYLHTGIGGTMSAGEATLQQQLFPEIISGQISDSAFISQMAAQRATVVPPKHTKLPKTTPCTNG